MLTAKRGRSNLSITGKFFNVFRSRTKQIIISPCFWVCVVCVVILCMTAPVYVDPVKGIKYSVVETIWKVSEEEILYHSECAGIKVFRAGLFGYIDLLLPIVVSLPFVSITCIEKRSRKKKFEMIRCNHISYLLAQCTSAVLSAGLVLVIGYAVFGVFALCYFPSISEYENTIRIPFYFEGNQALVVAKLLLCAFGYGAVSVLPSLFLISFISNEYVAVTIPFLLFYIEDVAINKISKGDLEESLKDKIRLMAPEKIGSLYSMQKDVMFTVLFHGTIVLVFFALYIAVERGKLDYGE